MSPERTADPGPRLRRPSNRASSRAVLYWTVRAGCFWLVPLALYLVIALLNAGLGNVVIWVIAAVAIAVAATHLTVMPRWRYAVHRWEVSPDAVYTQAGWFVQERRIAPISRIQTVDTHRGVFEQLFGLANVTVTTASAAGPLRIDALDRDLADDLVAELTRRTGATAGDAT